MMQFCTTLILLTRHLDLCLTPPYEWSQQVSLFSKHMGIDIESSTALTARPNFLIRDFPKQTDYITYIGDKIFALLQPDPYVAIAAWEMVAREVKSIILSTNLIFKLTSSEHTLEAALLEANHNEVQWGTLPYHHTLDRARLRSLLALAAIVVA